MTAAFPTRRSPRRIGLSQSACSRRLDNLEKSGVIRGYHARLSNAALGHQMTAIVHISLSGQFEKTLSDFEAAIKRCPNVLSCHLMSGEYDYILRIAAKDLVDYERIHKEWLSAHAACHQDQLVLRAARDRRPHRLRHEAGAAGIVSVRQSQRHDPVHRDVVRLRAYRLDALQ